MGLESDMESPYTIATLPKPLNADGQVYAAPVHSLRAAKKRKRHEVVVAVDGECLSIYNVSVEDCCLKVVVLMLYRYNRILSSPHMPYRRNRIFAAHQLQSTSKAKVLQQGELPSVQ